MKFYLKICMALNLLSAYCFAAVMPNAIIDVVSVPSGNGPVGITIAPTGAPNGPYAYVVNDSNVAGPYGTAININDTSTTFTFDINDMAEGVTITPNGEYLVVAASDILILQTTPPIDGSVLVAVSPQQVAVMPNGAYAYVTGTAAGSSYINAIDLASGPTWIAQANDVTSSAGDHLFGIAITPDGMLAYTTHYGGLAGTDDTVSIFNLSGLNVTLANQITVETDPWGVAITPNGNFVYVTNRTSGTVSVIDTNTQSLSTTITLDAGSAPQGIAITPDGSYAYVADNGLNSIVIIDTTSNTIAGVVEGIPGAWNLAITPDGSQVYVAAFNDLDVYILGAAVSGPVDVQWCQFTQGAEDYIVNKISWSAPTVNLPDSYRIYRDATLTDLAGTVSATTLQFFDYINESSPVPAYYVVGVSSSDEESAPDGATSYTPCYTLVNGPVDLQGCQYLEGADYINRLTWFAPTAPAPDVYTIYRDSQLTDVAGTVATAAGIIVFLDDNRDPLIADTYYIVGTLSGNLSTPQVITVNTQCTSAPVDLQGCQLVSTTDYINKLTWSAPTTGIIPVSYTIYRDSQLIDVAGTVSATNALQFFDYGRMSPPAESYYIVGVGPTGGRSIPQEVTVTTLCSPAVSGPVDVQGCQSADETSSVNWLTWEAPTTNVPTSYTIYYDAQLSDEAGTVSATDTLQFFDYNALFNTTYYIVGYISGQQSAPVPVTVNTSCESTVSGPVNAKGSRFQSETEYINQVTWEEFTIRAVARAADAYSIFADSQLLDKIGTVSADSTAATRQPATRAVLRKQYAFYVYGVDPTVQYTNYVVGEKTIRAVTTDTSAPVMVPINADFVPAVNGPVNAQGCQAVGGANELTWSAPTENAPTSYTIYYDDQLQDKAGTVLATGPLKFFDRNSPTVPQTYYIVGYGATEDEMSAPQVVTVAVDSFCIPAVNEPTNVQGCRTSNVFLTQTDYINKITWSAPTENVPLSYTIYRDATLTQVAGTVLATQPLQFLDHNRIPSVIETYYIVGVGELGELSYPQTVTASEICS